MTGKQLGGLLLLGAAYYLWQSSRLPDKPVPPYCPPNNPSPPTPTPPKPNPRPWGPQENAPVGADASVGGFMSPDGTEIHCPLPEPFHLKNRGGSDGAGLCVFASITHSAKWQSVQQLEDFFEWMFKHPGGGYPQKVTQMIEKKCKEQNLAIPDYIQVEGADLEILKTACKSGRMPGVTYSRSPTGRYNGQTISHMVSLPHADDKFFAVLDNNYPGENQIEWMTPAEFLKTYTGGSKGWAVILLDGGPPPVPHN